MSTRERLAVMVSPVFLRLVLGVTFLWAGLGKVMETMEVKGQDAATLASWGVIEGPASSAATPPPSAPSAAPAPPTAPASEPKNDAPAGDSPAKGTNDGKSGKDSAGKDNAGKTGEAKGSTEEQIAANTGGVRLPALLVAQATPAAPASPAPAPAVSPASPAFKADDFIEPVKVMRVYGIALLLHKSAATPAVREDGTTPMPLIPQIAATSNYPVILAWAAAITEIIGGAFALIGLFTRLSALGLASTMLVAIWLTQIGPSVQGGGAVLGFLPAHGRFDVPAWMPLMWQFSLLGAGLALFFSGSGMLSLDRLLFHKPPVIRPDHSPGANA